MKMLLLATAFAAPAQAQSVTSGCRAQGQALGYATANRYLGQRYDRNCQILSPVPQTPDSPEYLRSLEEMRERTRQFEEQQAAKPAQGSRCPRHYGDGATFCPGQERW